MIPLAKVVDINTDLTGDNDFGQVKDDYLQIHGQLVEIDYYYLPDQIKQMKPYHSVSVKGHEITMQIVEDNNTNGLVSLISPAHLYALPLEASASTRNLQSIIFAKVDENCFRRVDVATG